MTRTALCTVCVLQAKAWTQQKKIKLEGIVKKPGWKMAQQMLERGSRNEHELRVWLVSTCSGVF